jgi:hypothetical protein
LLCLLWEAPCLRRPHMIHLLRTFFQELLAKLMGPNEHF